MIHFQFCYSKKDKYFVELYNLYSGSFPENERRSYEGFVKLFEERNPFRCVMLTQNRQFIGFLTFWEFNQFAYIEHFAITSPQRGQSLGSKALKQFIKSISKPIVLEIEPPESEIAKRRMSFYEHLGFFLFNRPYMQPPYDKHKESVSLLLMCSKKKFLEETFKETKNTIYQYVYSQEV